MEATSVQTRAINWGLVPGATVAPARGNGRSRSIVRTLVIVSTVLVEAILILGLVLVSLGIGAERQTGPGPDRPPALATPGASREPSRLSPPLQEAPGPGGPPTAGWPPGRASNADSSFGSLELARPDE
jgi:hypothetical protein